jgi:hypothetical protein
VAAKRRAGFVSSFSRAVQPTDTRPEAVQSARLDGIRVVDDAVRERERAHTPLIAVGVGTSVQVTEETPLRVWRTPAQTQSLQRAIPSRPTVVQMANRPSIVFEEDVISSC